YFTSTPPPPLSPLSLHDALPISSESADERLPCLETAQRPCVGRLQSERLGPDFGICVFRPANAARHRISSGHVARGGTRPPDRGDRKSTRLNSSHLVISYAVFCL